jgi:hypothetical protein
MVNFSIALHRIYIQQNFQKILFKLDDLSTCYIISISRALDLYLVFFNNHMTGLGGNGNHLPMCCIEVLATRTATFCVKRGNCMRGFNLLRST